MRRTFGKDVLDQLALISLGQAAGLSLDDIRGMFTPSGPQIDRQVLAARADEIDALVRRLKAMSKGLRHAVACPAPSHMECPTFRKLLASAASGSIDRHWRQAGK